MGIVNINWNSVSALKLIEKTLVEMDVLTETDTDDIISAAAIIPQLDESGILYFDTIDVGNDIKY